MRTKIIVPIRPRNFSVAKRQTLAILKKFDLVEIWLDRLVQLTPANLSQLDQLATKQLIFNLKDQAEKGEFPGSPRARLDLLLTLKKNFVDLPLTFPQKLLTEFQNKSQAPLILSWHDFQKMPTLAKLQSLAKKAENKGAHIIKLVGTAQKFPDNLVILKLAAELQQRRAKFITLAMDKLGEITRVQAPFFGMFGMFAPLDQKHNTAPGQIPAAELKKWWQIFFNYPQN